jgi:general secretion pathway protein M
VTAPSRPTASAPSPASPALASLRQQAQTWWQARTPRERQGVSIIAAVVGLFLLWSLLVQPALRTLREAPAQLELLEAQYQQMQRVATESAALRGATRVSSAQAAQALRAATERLGDRARLNLQGDRATLTLSGVTPEALRAWLIEARSGARARPVEAQLQRGAFGYTGTLGLTLGGAL